MRVPGSRILSVGLVIGVLVIGALGIGATLAAPAHTNVASSPAATMFGTSGGNVASTLAQSALAATSAHGLNPRVISVPRPSASPEQVATSESSGHVTPLYDAAPAPSGLAYYGLREGKGGTVVPTILNTTSLMGTVDMNGPGIVAQDLYASSPDSYGIQLNAVTNIWNFSGGALSSNALYTTGLGCVESSCAVDDFSDYGSLGYYYSELVIPFSVSNPFD